MAKSIIEQFNNLPIEVRKIANAAAWEDRVSQIRMDQKRAKAAHKKFMQETNDHANYIRLIIERLKVEITHES